ncbi:hypothetical protein ACVWWO_000197 [Bradyrhizobium sp. F1.13.1]
MQRGTSEPPGMWIGNSLIAFKLARLGSMGELLKKGQQSA